MSFPLATLTGALRELFPTIWQHPDRADAIALWEEGEDEYCRRCGMSAPDVAVTERGCPACFGTRPPWKSVTRLGAYEPPLSEWIVHMKFGREWNWAHWLGERLAGQVARELPDLPGDAVVCPVPMHWTRRLRRGFNQAEEIARAIADARGLRQVNLLSRTRSTPTQTQVALSGRHANVRDSMRCLNADLAGTHVLLVDDVLTTGSTLRVATRCLLAAGADRVDVAIAAAADPPG